MIFRRLIFSALICTAGLEVAWADTVDVKLIYPPEDLLNAEICRTPGATRDSEAPLLLAMTDTQAAEKDPAPSTSAENVTRVNQLINADSNVPLEMFTFSPDYVEIQPGDTIRFLNSLGQHTVVSIKGMMPEGAEPFSISHKKVAEVRFEKPGIYGIRCRVHSRYGMVMMVKVGNELPNLEEARKKRHYRWAGKRFKQLFERLDQSL